MSWPGAHSVEEQVSTLPESMRRSVWALSQAGKICSEMKPRWTAGQAADEIVEMAEALLDFSYGGRAARLREMPYKQYLATPEWDEKRRAAYRKAGHRCQLCNASAKLHAHHRAYENRAKDG